MNEKYRTEATKPPPPPPPEPVRYTWREWWVIKRAEMKAARSARRAAWRDGIEDNWGFAVFMAFLVSAIIALIAFGSRRNAAVSHLEAECARLCWPKPPVEIKSPSDECYCNINAEAPIPIPMEMP